MLPAQMFRKNCASRIISGDAGRMRSHDNGRRKQQSVFELACASDRPKTIRPDGNVSRRTSEPEN